MKVKDYIFQHKLLPINLDRCGDFKLYAIIEGEKHAAQDNCGLVGLKPLTIAFCDSDVWYNQVSAIHIELEGRRVVELLLTPAAFHLDHFAFYSFITNKNYLRNLFQRAADLFFIALKNRIQAKHTFEMKATEIIKLFDFCVYPRPVYIISLRVENRTVCFPIDVLGFYKTNTVLLAIRKSNTACMEIMLGKAFLLSSAPFLQKDNIYQLGKNLPKNRTNPSTYETKFAHYSNIPYPDYVSELKQLRLISQVEIGEHYCFYCGYDIIKAGSEKGQLAHLPWYLAASFI